MLPEDIRGHRVAGGLPGQRGGELDGVDRSFVGELTHLARVDGSGVQHARHQTTDAADLAQRHADATLVHDDPGVLRAR